MSRTQEILKKWIDKNYTGVGITYPTDYTARILEKDGYAMDITINMFGDILDNRTKEIMAVSNLPHDLEKVGTKMPTDWKRMD